MTKQTADILGLVYEAMEELNADCGKAGRLEKSPDTPLFGPDSVLDSLRLVRLIVAAEQKIADEHGVTITLADERAMSQQNSPFRTAAALAAYAATLVEEQRRG